MNRFFWPTYELDPTIAKGMFAPSFENICKNVIAKQ